MFSAKTIFVGFVLCTMPGNPNNPQPIHPSGAKWTPTNVQPMKPIIRLGDAKEECEPTPKRPTHLPEKAPAEELEKAPLISIDVAQFKTATSIIFSPSRGLIDVSIEEGVSHTLTLRGQRSKLSLYESFAQMEIKSSKECRVPDVKVEKIDEGTLIIVTIPSDWKSTVRRSTRSDFNASYSKTWN